MMCSRCSSKSFVSMYVDEPKCMSCGHTEYQVPAAILKEVSAQLGKIGKGTKYIKTNAKKDYG